MADDQTKFWQQVTEAIAGKAGIDQQYNIMLASQGITCNLANNTFDANAALYQYGATMPKWSLAWDGTVNNSFFGMYKSWLGAVEDGMSQAPADPDAKKHIDELSSSLMQIQDGLSQIQDAQRKEFYSQHCHELTQDGLVCKVWQPGYNDQSFDSYWAQYTKSPTYKMQIRSIEQRIGGDIEGITKQLHFWQTKAYGSDYEALSEAVTAVTNADPKANNFFDNDDERKQYQMYVNESGVNVWEPRFTLQGGDTFGTFATWLQTAKDAANNGEDPEVTVALSNSTQEQTDSKWDLAFDAGIPVADFFMLGVRGSSSTSTLDISKYDFTATVSYQAIKHLSIGPADTWYDSSMLGKYFDYTKFVGDSPFNNKTLWGPQGIFNLRVSGLIVAYQPKIKMEIANWTQSELHTSFSASTDFSILGFISLGSASVHGEYNHVKYTATDSGFELVDNSGQPQIIALVVEKLNYNS